MTPLGTGEQVSPCPLQHFLCISDFQEEILVHITKASPCTHSSLKKQNRSDQWLASPFTSIWCAMSPAGNSQCFQEFLLCTTLHPNQTDGTGVRYVSGAELVSGSRSPNPPALALLWEEKPSFPRSQPPTPYSNEERGGEIWTKATRCF